MNGKRYSRQRELIYQAVCATSEHPTAEMVYQWLKPGNPSLSLGTVYRNLNVLSEDGLLRRMPFPVERYDARLDHHSHFRCTCCGRVFDMDLPQVNRLTPAEFSGTPYQVDYVDITLSGTCPDCIAS